VTTTTWSSREAIWSQARTELDGLPDGRGINIAYEAVDRHVAHGQGDRTAVRTVAADGTVTSVSYGELKALTSRFANMLDRLGVKPGEAVFSLLGRRLETYVTALGTLKHRSVFCPLFSAFGPAPVQDRLLRGAARVLVTTTELYERRITSIRAELPDLEPSCWSTARPRAPCPSRSYSPRAVTTTPSRPPTRKPRRCSTSRAGPPACPRGPCTSTRRLSRTTPPLR